MDVFGNYTIEDLERDPPHVKKSRFKNKIWFLPCYRSLSWQGLHRIYYWCVQCLKKKVLRTLVKDGRVDFTKGVITMEFCTRRGWSSTLGIQQGQSYVYSQGPEWALVNGKLLTGNITIGGF